MNHTLRVIPLGGLGEVGKNMMVIEYDHQILVIDAGLMFPENDMLGIDVVLPDYGYLLDKVDQVQAIVLTHGHEDHIGALPYLLRELGAPIYGTRLTLGLAETKLRRHQVLDRAEMHTIQDGDRLDIGPFDVEFFRVSHSIPDCVGLAIGTPVGTIVHSGDFKFDYTPVDGQPTDLGRLATLGTRGVLALLADSTNALQPGFTPSERVLDRAFDQVFVEAQGRIIVGTFASLISRLQQVLNCAKRNGRQVAIAGRTIADNVSIARKLGYIEIPDNTLISLDQSQTLPPERLVLLATGTQGEPSSTLTRMSTQRHPVIQIKENDTVIMSAPIIPGNEELVHRTINRLYQQGAHVVYDEFATVHVSGHACKEELKLLIQLLQPKFLVPIHGELRHLHAHARLAAEMGVPRDHVLVVENGHILEFTPDQATIGERVPGGYVFVDGAGIGDVGPSLMQEREQLANDGFVVVVIARSSQGQLLAQPRFVTRGFVFQPQASRLLDGVEAQVEQIVGRYAAASDAELGSALRRALADYFYRQTRRRPVIELVFCFDNIMQS
jgi:ribonuclease J